MGRSGLPGIRQSGIARSGSCLLCEREQLNCMELCLQSDDKPVESLWVKIRGQINRGDTIVGLCYRQPEQEEVDEAFRQLEAASYLQALVLMRLQLPQYLVEEATQQGRGNLGGFWNALVTTC